MTFKQVADHDYQSMKKQVPTVIHSSFKRQAAEYDCGNVSLQS